jgi:hypothetical protein
VPALQAPRLGAPILRRVSGRVPVNLTEEERALLVRGLREWGGPTRATDLVARAMGFKDVDALYAEAKTIACELEAEQPLVARDWARALIATEIAFASDYYGSGWDWSIVSGFSDHETLQCLRQIQRKLIGVAEFPLS